jgi:hypothetical protein
MQGSEILCIKISGNFSTRQQSLLWNYDYKTHELFLDRAGIGQIS